MKDPTRIPIVIDALQRAWEAQPDLELATLWGLLENRGVGWGSGDDEVLTHLRDLLRLHPPVLRTGELSGKLAIVETESPRRRITLDSVDARVTVRAFDEEIRPTTWTGATIRRLTAGTPLVLTDPDGIDHRLGIVRSMHVLERPDSVNLGGRSRHSMGDSVYGVLLTRDDNAQEVGDFAVVGHAVDVQSVGRRTVAVERVRFSHIKSCAAGSDFRLSPASGGPEINLGQIRAVFPLAL